MRGLAVSTLAASLVMAAASAAIPSPDTAPPFVEVLADGIVAHRPSGLRIPLEIHPPTATHRAAISAINATAVEVRYGPVTLKIGAPTMAADAIMTPPGFAPDGDPPALPGLKFWGETARPVTTSFLSADAAGEDWLSHTVIVQGWQIEISALYLRAHRETIVGTAEAVWGSLAPANADEPR